MNDYRTTKQIYAIVVDVGIHDSFKHCFSRVRVPLLILICLYGGIGRHAGFKHQCPSGRMSSNLIRGTKYVNCPYGGTVDTADSKSVANKVACGFKSH